MMSAPRGKASPLSRCCPRLPAKNGVSRGVGCLVRDERGAVTVEFTVLVPFFVFLLVLFADATVIYLSHSEMYNAARELSRSVSTGEVRNQAEAEAYVADKLFLGDRDYYVYVDFDQDKTVTIAVNVYDAAIFGLWFTPLVGRELVATATVAEEPRIE